MKKVFLTLSLLALAVIAFGQNLPLSVGGYLGFEGVNSNYKVSGTPTGMPAGYTQSYESLNGEQLLTVGAFFDAKYLVVGLGLETQLGKLKNTEKTSVTGSPSTDSSSDQDTQYLNLDISLLGKYPFAFDKLVVFPLAGFEYSPNLTAMDKDSKTSDQKAELNDIYFDLGGGLDYAITKTLYIRGQAIFGLNLTPENKALKDSASSGLTYTDFGYKLNLTISLGYKL